MKRYGKREKSKLAAAALLAMLCIEGIMTAACMSNPKNISKRPLPSLSNTVWVPATEENGQTSRAAGEQKTARIENSKDVPGWQTIRMQVTAYCPCTICCGRSAKGLTASGHVVQRGDRFIAAPKEFPFGTEIIVPQYNGQRPAKVLDRGGAIQGNHLDLFFMSHSKAIKWGVKYLDVKIRTGKKPENGIKKA